MKKIFLLLAFCCLGFEGFSTTWYSQGNTALTTLGNWNSVAGGGGTVPTTFATVGDIWVVQTNMTIAVATWTIGGSLQINTGSRIGKTAAAGVSTINVGQDFSIAGSGRVTTAGGSSGNFNININGNLSLTGTSFVTSTGASNVFINFANTASTFAAPQTLTWTATGASTLTSITVNSGCYVQLLSALVCPATASTGITVNGSLICGTNAITTAAANPFTISAGASLYTANTTGLNGTVGATFTRTFSGAANYIFNSTAAAQTTGTYLPAAMLSGGSVTIDNTFGAVTLSQTTSFASGATLNLETGAFTNTAANLVMNSGSNVNRDNGTLAVTPTTYSGVNLTYETLGVNTLAVTTGNEWPASFSGNVTVNKTGATITLQNAKTLPVLATFGNITLTAGTLASANFNRALSGKWMNNSGAAAFTAGTDGVTMNGTAAQTLGGSAATTFYNFTVNNAAGVTLGNTETVNNTLTLTAGRTTLGTNNLILGTAATAIAGAFSATNMIVATGTGAVRKNMNASGLFLYPVGDATGPNYTPITLNFTGGSYTAGAYAGVNLKNVKHPNNANVTDFLKRYWTVSLNNITAPVYSVAATYVAPGDVTGTEANMSTGIYSGALPWGKGGLTNTVTHTLSATGITGAADFTGISTAGPTVTSTANTAVCAGTPVGLSEVTATGDPTLIYSWAPATGLSATTGAAVTATPTVTTTYTLTITDGNGFTGTTTTTVTINPVPGVISGVLTTCVGGGTTLSDTPLGGTWSSTTGAASINATTGAVSGTAAGTTMISYIAAGCAATTIVTVNAPGGPIFGPSALCTSASITLTDAIGGGLWTSTAGTGTATIGSTSGIVNGTTAGTVIISYTTAGCNPATAIISVNAYPSPISGPSAVCVNATIPLSDLSGGGGWTSSAAGTASVGASSGLVLGVAAGTATISYDISGCPVTHVVTVNPLPVAISGPTSVCMTYSVTLSDASGSGTWSSSSPLVASVGSSTGVVTGVATGATYITYTFTSTGCSSPALLETVYANPTPVFGANSVCMGGTTNLTDPDGGTWSSALPTTASVGSGTGVVTGVAIGSTTITFTALATGCFALQPMTVNPNPSAITGPTIVCAGSTVTLTDATTGGTWSSNEFWIASIGTDGVVTGITGGGTTTISYVLATSCYTTFTESVNAAPSVIMGDSTLCVGYSTILSDSVGGGTWSSSAPGSIIADPSTGNMLAIATGAVTIFYTITGCNPVSHNITVNAIPATITGADHLCDSVSTNLYDLITGGVWSSANTTVARIDSTTGLATGVSLGTTNISYTFSTGCYVVLPVTVNPLAPPIAGTDTICSTGSTWLTDIVGGGTWMSSNAAVATIDTFTGLLTGIVPGITYIVYTLPTGCTASLLETAIPPVTPISSPSHVCTGSVINMTDAEPGGTWISSNNYVASVGGTSGVLSGGFPDTVNITYTISAFRGCYTSKTIIVNPLPTPVITYNYPTHSVSTYSYYTGYQWYTSTTGLIPGATGPTLVLPHAGDSVYVDVTDTNGCSSRASWYVYNYSGVSNIAATTARMYPNPATSTLFIDASVNVRAVISGIDGKKVMEQANAKEVNISALAAGMYLVALYDDEGQIVMMQKLVKE